MWKIRKIYSRTRLERLCVVVVCPRTAALGVEVHGILSVRPRRTLQTYFRFVRREEGLDHKPIRQAVVLTQTKMLSTIHTFLNAYPQSIESRGHAT